METLKNGSERALNILKNEYEKKMQEVNSTCKEDIQKIDGLRSQSVQRAELYKHKYQKAASQITELKEVLQMAADADQRKDALVDEVRASARDANDKLDRDRD